MSNLEKARTIGPVEVLAVQFPGNKFSGEILPALTDLVEAGIVRIIDLVFITKDTEGNVASLEVSALPPEVASVLEKASPDATDLINEEDIEGVGSMLDPNSSVGLLVFENTWAARFTETLRNADGKLLMNVRIPHQVVVEALEAAFGPG